MAEVPAKAQAARAAKEEQLAGEIRCRKVQLECTETAISKLKQELQASPGQRSQSLTSLSATSEGFYDEIDKLVS